jgi:hypothetical protein
MGRNQVLSEMYGCTGWDFTFEGHKAVGDWQAALGVNLRCHHLSWYTMKGEAKRDYPASIFFQSPWWEHYSGAVEDYYSRIHVALTQGEAIRRLLVIHPIESMWLKFVPPRFGEGAPGDMWNQLDDEINNLNAMLPQIRNILLEEHLDFDYGDETMLPRHAAISRKDGKPQFKVGQASYDAILVPPMDTIRDSTLQLLTRFQKAGGKVVFCETPRWVDAAVSDEAAKVAARCEVVPLDREKIIGALEGSVRRVSIQDTKGKEIPSALYMLRQDKDKFYLFICNTDRKKGFDKVVVKVWAEGNTLELDTKTGEVSSFKSKSVDGVITFETSLPVTGSRLFMIDPKAEGKFAAKVCYGDAKKVPLAAPVGINLSEPNALVLDCPAFRVGNGKCQEPLEILKVDRAIRTQMGLPFRGGQMEQPWARKVDPNEKGQSVELCYTFGVKELPVTPVFLALETAERFSIQLNGHSLVYDDAGDGWWVDPCLQRLRIDPAIIRQGENKLCLQIDYRSTDGLEAMFLTGDFGVVLEGTMAWMSKPVRSLKIGDWVKQGLPFYSGAVSYRFSTDVKVVDGQHVFVEVPGFAGTMVRVLVNGKQAGYISWAPYELDITSLLSTDGSSEIILEVFSSRRNAFGPLHLSDPNPGSIGPDSFLTEGTGWNDEYMLKPCGLIVKPVLSCRKPA